MIIKIGEYECTECWDGVFYKKLSDYPNITEWEIQTVYDFINYEKQNGRACSVEADDSILKKIQLSFHQGKEHHLNQLFHKN